MPIDTRMNAIIHASLRRDLDRTALILDEPTQLSPERLQLLGTHVVWLMDLLHDHHTTEDARLFPVVRDHDPDAGPLLDAMDAEHEAISEAAAALHRAGRRAEAADAGAANAIRTAIIDLRAVLDPHLEHEERALPPVVARCVPEREWRAFEKSNVEGKKPPELAFQGHWFLDNLDPAHAEVVKSKVPVVPRLIMLRFLAGRYRRRRDLLWGGTPAEQVPARVTPAG